MRTVLIIALKEFQDGLRNRWVLAISVIFALLALGIAYFGGAASGTVGFTSLATTIVSLASLAIFLVPLIALMLSYDAIAGEEAQGMLLLLLTYPMERWHLLFGKFCGQAAIIAVSSLLGFGLAGVLVAGFSQQVEHGIWSAFGFFVLSTTLLGWVFVAMALLISAWASEKARAGGLALAVWFWFVIVFDLALLGALVLGAGRLHSSVLAGLLMLNPTDVFRLANLTGFEATRSYTGLAAVAHGPLFQPWALTAVLVVWVAATLGLALWRFHRRRV